jgi:predicted CoA-binding protein
MTETPTNEILRRSHTIFVVDWPSRDVPDSLALAGFEVAVKGGPGPEDYFAYENENGKVVVRRTGKHPQYVDMVYAFRPLDELPGIIETAKSLGAKTIWLQSGLTADNTNDPRGCWLPNDQKTRAIQQAQAANLTLITQPYIADAARGLHS